jgi:hypothetical protein
MEKPMASDERDRTFEKALTRHLRSAAPSPASANLPAGQSASCLDPETLAAYHERSLLPEQMNSAKEHIVACAHCQAILTHLEVTDSIALPAAEKQEVLVMTPAPAALPQKPPASRISHGVRWQRLAPVGALAAGLLVWVAWHENQHPGLPAANEIKMAKAQEPSAPLPQVTREAPASPSSDQLEGLSRGRVVGGVASSKTLEESENLKQLGKFDSRARASVPKPSTNKEAELRKDVLRDSVVAGMRAESQPDLDAKNVVGGVAGTAQEKVEQQNQAANIQTQNQMISPKVAGPGPLSQVEQKKKAKSPSPLPALGYREAAPAAAPPPAPAPPARAAPAFGDTASMELAAVSNPHLIAAPGAKALWRAGRAGVIEFYSDNGASWSRQVSGVLVDLTAGSAPSDKVCWIVGRVGAIVRTTDGGEHWSVIHPPVEEDLAIVHAADALHATVWTAHHLKAFETSDGGVTWKPVTNH